MRAYPRRLFKDGQKTTVYNETEEFEHGQDGWESSAKPEIVERRRGTDRDVLRVNPDSGEGHKDVIAPIIEVIKQELEETQELPSPAEQFKNSTGKNALCDRGPFKGKPTKQFQKWMKEHGYSE